MTEEETLECIKQLREFFSEYDKMLDRREQNLRQLVN